jgi:membrane-associated phospholipid phosphatase
MHERGSLLPCGRGDFVRQLAIWLGFVVAYQVARGLADRGTPEAVRNARRVIRVERDVHAFFEPDLQRRVVERGGMLVHAVDWTYWLSQLAVVVLALLWIYLRHNDAYLRFRNTLMVTNAIGLVCYVALPTAPPWLFPQLGFVDTLAQSELVNHKTGLVAALANPYASMPSLHAADALIIGGTLASVARRPIAKAMFLLWPAWVCFSLIATANHFWLDIAAGLAVAAVGAWTARLLERRALQAVRQDERDGTRPATA